MKTVEKKQERLGLRLNREQKERIERAASLTGQTVSSFVASEALKRSDEIIARENVRILSDRDFDDFVCALDEDAEPNDALKAAAEEYKRGRHEGGRYYSA